MCWATFLAVVLAGKGVAALQEAGLIDVQPLGFVPRIDLLGLTSTVQSVLAQLVMLAAVLFGFWYNRRVARKSIPPGVRPANSI